MILLGTRKNRSFKDSLKLLEADIQHANTMSLGLSKGKEGGVCLQMRLGYGPAFLLCFFSWADCSLVGALGLLHILIYKVLKDGTTTMSVHERKASLREFYGYILPSLQVLDGGITERERLEQKAICTERYKRKGGDNAEHESPVDLEREQECGICLETVAKVVLPGCNHSMCIKCYRDWRSRSTSCPFCRTSLKRVNSRDLWIYMDSDDVMDSETMTRDNLRRLFLYVDKLPLVISNSPYNIKPKCPS